VRRFEPGEAIALREVWRGRIWSARAATVVQDQTDQTMLFIPAGARWKAAALGGRRLKVPQEGFELVDQPAARPTSLSFAWPSTGYAVLLFFRPNWSPEGWYVNLEDPLRRTRAGFDTLDHELDAVLELDGSWRWKDEEELAEAIRRGVLPSDAEPRLREEGERAVRRIVDREPPFDRDWTTWRPDPSWTRPELPAGWDELD
jgi:hypothetical protein